MILVGILFIVIGIVDYWKPEAFWMFRQGWKSERGGEPSEAYKAWTRMRGGLMAFGGIVIIVMHFVMNS